MIFNLLVLYGLLGGYVSAVKGLPVRFQYAALQLAKGYLSACKRWPFRLQNTAFYTVKGYELGDDVWMNGLAVMPNDAEF